MNITENQTFKQLYVTTTQGIEHRIPSRNRATFLDFIGARGESLPLSGWYSPNAQSALEAYGEIVTNQGRQITIFDALAAMST